MKKIILFIFATACCLAAGRAQVGVQYQSVFGDSVARWAEFYMLDQINFNVASYSEVYEILTDDTLRINENVYREWRLQYNDWTGQFYDGSRFAFRESSDHGKLYLKVLSTDMVPQPVYDTAAEILIMDLDLEVGDTLDTESWWDLLRIRTTIRIDSVYYEDGRKILVTSHRRQMARLQDEVGPLKFIEGIGPNFGMMYAIMLHNEYTESLLCYHRDEELLYTGVQFVGNCEMGWTIGIVDNIRQPQIAISPNPTSGMLKITCPDVPEGTATVISPLGKLLCTAPIRDGAAQLDISAFSPGVYVVNIVSGTVSIAQKVVKL